LLTDGAWFRVPFSGQVSGCGVLYLSLLLLRSLFSAYYRIISSAAVLTRRGRAVCVWADGETRVSNGAYANGAACILALKRYATRGLLCPRVLFFLPCLDDDV